MHEFMEYVFEPPYKRLHVAMAAPVTDKKVWKGIKSDALILAEGGNLLLSRVPEKDGEAWTSNATEVRKLGGQFYRAAKKRDYPAAMKAYATMLKSCNACHNKFADGKHQLKP